MNNNISQRYRDEMMRYYSMQKSRMPAQEESAAAEEPRILSVISDIPSDKRPDTEQNISEEQSEADLSVLRMQETSNYSFPEYAVQENLPDEYGKLRIEATSGSRSSPVDDVLVIITRPAGDSREVLATLLTDSSGLTQTIGISAPAGIFSGSPSGRAVNASVDITAYKKGFYEVENRNVPVFSGITSIQPVNMIPLPLDVSEQKIIYTEHEPNL